MTNTEIDAYAAKLPAAQQKVIAALRKLMATQAPALAEVISYGQPTWKGKKMVATLKASPAHITFVFSKGASFTDAHGLLEGTGNVARHIKLATLSDVDTAALTSYITQAVKLDA